MKKQPPIPAEKVAAIRTMHQSGHSYREIAKALGISHQTAFNYVHRKGSNGRNGPAYQRKADGQQYLQELRRYRDA